MFGRDSDRVHWRLIQGIGFVPPLHGHQALFHQNLLVRPHLARATARHRFSGDPSHRTSRESYTTSGICRCSLSGHCRRAVPPPQGVVRRCAGHRRTAASKLTWKLQEVAHLWMALLPCCPDTGYSGPSCVLPSTCRDDLAWLHPASLRRPPGCATRTGAHCSGLTGPRGAPARRREASLPEPT